MTHPNVRLVAAWDAENATRFQAAIAHHSIDEMGMTVIPPRTRHRALGFVAGWDACRMALQNEIGAFVNEYIRTAATEQMITAAEVASRIEAIIRQHAAAVREAQPEAEKEVAA